jgi:hypothetical protein
MVDTLNFWVSMNWASSGAIEMGWNLAPSPRTAMAGAQGLGLLGIDALVGGEHPLRGGRVAEELGAEPLGAEPEPDGLPGVGDGREAFKLAGPGIRLHVEQVGRVLLDSAHPDDPAALAVGDDRHPVRVDEVDLGGQHAGSSAGGDDAPGVAA